MSASSSRPKVNLRSTAVKRIMQEASELADPEGDDFVAAPLETDIFEWHCTMRGVPGSEFEGGLYHIRILLPPTYPMSAPDIMLLTPNGRFELGKKARRAPSPNCVHRLGGFEQVRSPAVEIQIELMPAITGLRSFWMQGGEALSAIGALDYPKEERKRLARLSKDWMCPTCGVRNQELLSDAPAHTPPAPIATTSEAAEEAVGPTVPKETSRPGGISNQAEGLSQNDSEQLPSSSAAPAPVIAAPPESLTRATATIPAPVTTLPSHVAHVPPTPAASLTQRFVPAGSQPAPARDARPTRPPPVASATSVSSPPSWLPSYQSMRQLIDLSILFLVFVLLGMLVRKAF